MLSQGQELGALNFDKIIGGPLNAVINAQANAANLTAGFIQNVGFVQGAAASGPGSSGGNQQLKTVSFDFSQMFGQGGPNSQLNNQLSIKVPLLTLVPIPFIRIDSMTIQFNVRLLSTQTTQMTNNFAFNNSDDAGESGLFGAGPSVDIKATVTDQNTFQNNQVVDDTYSLNVTVHAVQDQMPGGMAQVLNIFSNLIQTQATLIQAAMTAQVQNQQALMQSSAASSAAAGGAPASAGASASSAPKPPPLSPPSM